MSDNITGAHGAGDQVAAFMVDSWLEEGREFTARMAAAEVGLINLRMTEASYGRVRKLGFARADLHNTGALSSPVVFALRTHHDSSVYRGLITPCDVSRIVDAFHNLTDEDAGVLAYEMSDPGIEGTEAEHARAFSFLPTKYVTSILDQHNVITKKPNTALVEGRIQELATQIAAISTEAAEINIAAGQHLKLIQTDKHGGHTVYKRTYSGDDPETSAISLSECAMVDFQTALVGDADYPEADQIFTLHNDLTGREISLRNLAGTKKKNVAPGATLTMHGADMASNWYLAVKEHSDA